MYMYFGVRVRANAKPDLFFWPRPVYTQEYSVVRSMTACLYMLLCATVRV